MEDRSERTTINYANTVSRLRDTLKMLKKEPGIIEEYEVVIKEQLQAGIIETVKKMESNSRAHYIPHHTVVRR